MQIKSYYTRNILFYL